MRHMRRELKLPKQLKKIKTNHGGARQGAGRKPANALTCATCQILSEQLRAANEREKALMKQLERKDSQIGMVIENKFETVRVSGPLPQMEKPALPVDQLMDVEATDDQGFLNALANAVN